MRTEVSQTRRDDATSFREVAPPAAVRVLAGLSLAAVVGLAGTPAFGQGAQPCTAIDNDAERLACYDRALRPAPPSAAAPAPAPAEAPSPRAASPAPARTPPAATAEPRRVRESAATAAPAAPVEGGPREAGIVPIVVVSLHALPGRETTFTTADGTRWVQTDSGRLVGIPDTPFDAEIKPGTMGSSFLVPKERGRAIRVRPVRAND